MTSVLRRCTGPGLFRLLLASLVFVHHLSRFALGPAAVYLFFCLSGYWIYRMWTARYAKTTQPYLTYLVSRAWRLLPDFILLAGIAIAVECALGASLRELRATASWPHFVLSHLFILGYDRLPMKPLVPAWSLDYEMQFYLVAPLLAALLTQTRRVLPLVAATAAVSLASAWWLGEHALPSYLLFFVLGMAAARCEWKPSGRMAAAGAALAALVLAVVLAGRWRGMLIIGTHPGPLAHDNLPMNVLLSLLVVPYALYTTRQKGFAADGMFADLSYLVYLLHWPGMKLLSAVARLRLPRLEATAAICLGVYLAAYVIWRLYDRPINDRRARWVAARRAGRPQLEAIEAEPAAP